MTGTKRPAPGIPQQVNLITRARAFIGSPHLVVRCGMTDIEGLASPRLLRFLSMKFLATSLSVSRVAEYTHVESVSLTRRFLGDL